MTRKRPISVTVTSFLILVNVLIWLILGILIITDTHIALPDQPLIKGIMAVLSLIAAGVLLALFFLIRHGNRTAYFLTLAVFIITALLVFFDDVGVSDLVVLSLNLTPIVLLIKDRAWYRKARPRIERAV
jgi:lysylphosphatidylglycerol synthetase-like protein (DUF2156 family)